MTRRAATAQAPLLGVVGEPAVVEPRPSARFNTAAVALAEAELGIRRGTVEEAARRSYGYTSGKFTLEEAMACIEAIRLADQVVAS